MDEDIQVAMMVVIDYLDTLMQEEPNRRLADCCNYLQELVDQDE